VDGFFGVQKVAGDLLLTSPKIILVLVAPEIMGCCFGTGIGDTESPGARPCRHSVVPEIASLAATALPELSRTSWVLVPEIFCIPLPEMNSKFRVH
jgi:hypothetical protein